MEIMNRMDIRFLSIPENESFARVAVSAFAVQLNPTLDVLADIKTAVSEAVTNAIVHGYRESEGMVEIEAIMQKNGVIRLIISDSGCGIDNVEQAMQPFFTSQPEKERSGMGFSVMQTFMDKVEVASQAGEGTQVIMEKKIMAG